MSEPEPAGLRVAALDDVPDEGAVVVGRSVSGYHDDIAVFRVGGDVYALDDTCTHARASLSQGWVADGVVECPRHGSGFCLRTGAVQGLPATVDARTHRVDVVGGDVVLFPGEPARRE